MRQSVAEARQQKPLSATFFTRDASIVARELLGKLLVRRYGHKLLIGRVVEAEAYLGQVDPAAHAYAGQTPRNAVLFGPPGIAYVYFIYGNYYCMNVSCMPEGNAGCVLLRALEPVAGLAIMAKLRGLDLRSTASIAELRSISSGPGRLTQAMAITRQVHNGMALTSASSELYFADDGWRPERIATTPRINVTKAADRPLRYVIAGNLFVSGKRVL
jgi:DNA-3-methyladenine glycosylase